MLTGIEEILMPDCFKNFNAFSTVSDGSVFDYGFIKDSESHESNASPARIIW